MKVFHCLLLLYYRFVRVQAFAVLDSVNDSSRSILPTQERSSGGSVGGEGQLEASHNSRRRFLTGLISSVCLVSPGRVVAATKKEATDDPVVSLIAARETLQKLLENWEKAVIDCTFADVPRELLEQRNKEELLEKASTFALFDKSVSVETCKTTNRVVRDYLGATGIGPVVGLEKQMKRALDRVKPDNLDDFVVEIERIEQLLSKARSLAYTAGVADFNSVNNFEKDQTQAVLANNSNLEQSRQSIQQIVDGLKKIETFLE